MCSPQPRFVCLDLFSFHFFLHLKAQFVSFSHSYTGSDCSREENLLIVFAVALFLACSAAALNIRPVFECADGCFAGMSIRFFQTDILSFKLWTVPLHFPCTLPSFSTDPFLRFILEFLFIHSLIYLVVCIPDINLLVVRNVFWNTLLFKWSSKNVFALL